MSNFKREERKRTHHYIDRVEEDYQSHRVTQALLIAFGADAHLTTRTL